MQKFSFACLFLSLKARHAWFHPVGLFFRFFFFWIWPSLVEVVFRSVLQNKCGVWKKLFKFEIYRYLYDPSWGLNWIFISIHPIYWLCELLVTVFGRYKFCILSYASFTINCKYPHLITSTFLSLFLFFSLGQKFG